jgi:hypothetical protein
MVKTNHEMLNPFNELLFPPTAYLCLSESNIVRKSGTRKFIS